MLTSALGFARASPKPTVCRRNSSRWLDGSVVGSETDRETDWGTFTAHNVGFICDSGGGYGLIIHRPRTATYLY